MHEIILLNFILNRKIIMNNKQNTSTNKNEQGQTNQNIKRGFQPAKNPPNMPKVKPPKQD